jgi:hypothetical protein
MSKLSLLIWMEKGKRTKAQADKSGRSDRDEWFECYMRGLFKIGEDDSLALTEAGHAELSDARMGTG